MSRKNPGDFITPFTVEAIYGSLIKIPHSSQLTHLQFRRFAGCPMCNLHIQSFIQRYEEITANGIHEVAVFHSPKSALIDNHSSAPFPLIADPMKLLYKAFGVEPSIFSVLNPKAWPPAIKGLLHHGMGLPARGESIIGLPADFLIDSSGRVVAAKYGVHAYDQWQVDELLHLAGTA